jgi:hypothetical protein
VVSVVSVAIRDFFTFPATYELPYDSQVIIPPPDNSGEPSEQYTRQQQ